MRSNTEMVTCPNCGCQVYEHALKLRCYAHVPGDDADTRQKVQQQERATVYRTEGEEYSDG